MYQQESKLVVILCKYLRKFTRTEKIKEDLFSNGGRFKIVIDKKKNRDTFIYAKFL